MSALVTASWIFSNVGNNTTSEDNEHLRAFGTHGNETVFFYYPAALMDFAAACLIIFAIVGVFGNFVSILALSKSKKLRNATTAFIVNLCVADLLFCGFSMPLSALTFLERHWNYGDVLCKLFPLVGYSNGAVSLFSVIAITINRYILIVHPNVYRDMYKPRNIAIMIGFIWMSALVLLIFPLFEVWGKFGYDPKVGTCSIMKLNGRSPKMTFCIVAFGLPSMVFPVCYSRIYWVVHQASERARKDSLDNVSINKTALRRSKQELKVLRMIMVIFITFVLCYVPVIVVKIFKKEDDMPILNIFGYLGFYFSNIINPVIYIVMSNEYRKAYLDLFCFCSAKSPKPPVL
ncbi:g-protein coupled receptor moody [Caerostris darwini]|uniref:G-protein coupled receptor moody n=1 Tax=Caerostris darwini TaxID=1538125 RepID=A0AAV4MD43_9ARAC|nr:g-protein coupled receptor moody [Caerostris darwini]